MLIRTREELSRWLEENFWLEDAWIVALEPIPGTEPSTPTPRTVRLIVDLQVSGGIRAGQRRRMRRLRITASEVTEYSLSAPDGFVPGHCAKGAELFDTDATLGISLDVPADLWLACGTMDIEQEEREETIEPWYSDRSFSAVVPGHALPSPSEWQEWCEGRGVDAVWRNYASEAIPPEEVPPDYSGWFLQLRSRLSQDPQGLFFFSCGPKDGGFHFHVENYAAGDDRSLWNAVAEYVTQFPAAAIHCGNATLTRDEWHRFHPR